MFQDFCASKEWIKEIPLPLSLQYVNFIEVFLLQSFTIGFIQLFNYSLGRSIQLGFQA